MLLRFTLLFILFGNLSYGQSIRFVEADLESAISMAKRQNKNIFIDTYASYCKPCKKMDIEFRDENLANYFNSNFVNVKVNMEHEKAEAFKSAYSIVFLPTLLFVNPEGQMRMSIDHLINAKDLLKMGKHINGDNIPTPASKPTVSAAPQPATARPKAPPVQTTPTPKPTSTPTQTIAEAQPKSIPQEKQTPPPSTAPPKPQPTLTDDEDGTILYVMGQDSDNLPPEILREEAYFRMQLMDGSHKAAAKKYLASQDDWSTEENMRFIHDFIDDARSKEFNYLIENRKAFEQILSKEVISQSINILVNKELERAYPRPDEQRVRQLLSHAGAANPALGASVYALNNIYTSGNTSSFLDEAKDIIFQDDIEDANILYRYSMALSQKDNSKRTLKKCLHLAEKSIALDPTKALFNYNAAQIALLLKYKPKALALVREADRLNDNPEYQGIIDEMMRLIEEL